MTDDTGRTFRPLATNIDKLQGDAGGSSPQVMIAIGMLPADVAAKARLVGPSPRVLNAALSQSVSPDDAGRENVNDSED